MQLTTVKSFATIEAMNPDQKAKQIKQLNGLIPILSPISVSLVITTDKHPAIKANSK
jgi:hypothetical protein